MIICRGVGVGIVDLFEEGSVDNFVKSELFSNGNDVVFELVLSLLCHILEQLIGFIQRNLQIVNKLMKLIDSFGVPQVKLYHQVGRMQHALV